MELKFNTLDRMRARWDAVGRKNELTARTAEEFARWRRETLDLLIRLTGYDTMQWCELRPTILDVENKGRFIRQRVAIQTEPDLWMPFYVLIPKDAPGPFQPVIACHGHCSNGKAAVVGEPLAPEHAESIRLYNYDFGRQLCEAGFIVFCPDARGFGERREAVDDTGLLGSSCRYLHNMAIPLGQTVTGMWAWDLRRLIDYIELREDCRADETGCVGLSGGGLQTLWTAVFDERVRCAVVSGYFYGYKLALLDNSYHCWCNYIPHLWEHVDMGEVAALIAPRPLLIETGDQDPLNGATGLENVLTPLRTVERAYALAGRPDLLRHSINPGGHQWYGTGVVEWLRMVQR